MYKAVRKLSFAMKSWQARLMAMHRERLKQMRSRGDGPWDRTAGLGVMLRLQPHTDHTREATGEGVRQAESTGDAGRGAGSPKRSSPMWKWLRQQYLKPVRGDKGICS